MLTWFGLWRTGCWMPVSQPLLLILSISHTCHTMLVFNSGRQTLHHSAAVVISFWEFPPSLKPQAAAASFAYPVSTPLADWHSGVLFILSFLIMAPPRGNPLPITSSDLSITCMVSPSRPPLDRTTLKSPCFPATCHPSGASSNVPLWNVSEQWNF